MTDQHKPLATTKAVITHFEYQTIITSGKHSIIADEPKSAGGLDTGPSPSELLLASLASCTAITLQMYINRKMWVVKEITINLELFGVDNGTLIKKAVSVIRGK